MNRWATLCVSLLLASPLPAAEPIRLANNPALSADGQWLAFDWNGDVWIAPAAGGEARQLTAHPGRDTQPKFSPDGKNDRLHQRSRRKPAASSPCRFDGGAPRQLTFHTAGAALQEWSPDGNSLLIKATRDHFWRARRTLLHHQSQGTLRRASSLFDDYGNDGALSPDGKKLLFTREGGGWWRKGYNGSRTPPRSGCTTSKPRRSPRCCTTSSAAAGRCGSPTARASTTSSEHAKGSNLRALRFRRPSRARLLTKFKEDSVVFPTIARDGSRIVFRHLFDLYSLDLKTRQDQEARHLPQRRSRRQENRNPRADVGDRGRVLARRPGDRLHRRRRPVGHGHRAARAEADHQDARGGSQSRSSRPTASRSSSSAASAISSPSRRRRRENPKQFWWQNREFEVTAWTRDAPNAPRISSSAPTARSSPTSAACGDLYVSRPRSRRTRPCRSSPTGAPPITIGRPTANGSSTPNSTRTSTATSGSSAADGNGQAIQPLAPSVFASTIPVWSPDGKMIAFAGRRASGEPGGQRLRSSRSVRRRRKDGARPQARKSARQDEGPTPPPSAHDGPRTPPKKSTDVAIDFDACTSASSASTSAKDSPNTLFWSPDSKKLAFTGSYRRQAWDLHDRHRRRLDAQDVDHDGRFKSRAGSRRATRSSGSSAACRPARPASPSLPRPTPTPTPRPIAEERPRRQSNDCRGCRLHPRPAAATRSPFASKSISPSATPSSSTPAGAPCATTGTTASSATATGTRSAEVPRSWPTRLPTWNRVTTVVQMMLGELNGSHLGFTLNPASPATPAAACRAIRPHTSASASIRLTPAPA